MKSLKDKSTTSLWFLVFEDFFGGGGGGGGGGKGIEPSKFPPKEFYTHLMQNRSIATKGGQLAGKFNLVQSFTMSLMFNLPSPWTSLWHKIRQ